jgi:hypothetical protein
MCLANSLRHSFSVDLRMYNRSPCSLAALITIWTYGCGWSVCRARRYRCLSANSSRAKSRTDASSFKGGVPAGIEKTILWTIRAGSRRPAFSVVTNSSAQLGGRMLYASSAFRWFDSLAVESNGNICVGTLYPGAITVIHPGGGLVEEIATDDPFTTNICFGGPDLRTAFTTLSTTGELVACRWPRPGLRFEFLSVSVFDTSFSCHLGAIPPFLARRRVLSADPR